MASYLDKVQINTAITDNTKMDLSSQSITTMDFMQLNVGMIHEMVPGEKIDVNMETFARLNPLPVPTFGRANMRHRAFFVPFHTIFRGWNDFITDSVHIPSDGYNSGSNLLGTVPFVDMVDLADLFKNNIGTSSEDGNNMLYPSTTVGVYDVSWTGAQGYYNFTVKGRMAIKLLEQLGYKVDFDRTDKGCIFSALPLLALCRIFCDWYYPMQYANTYIYDYLLSLCNFDVAIGPKQLSVQDLSLLLMVCSWVCYDSDYFTSAFDNPNSPNANNYSGDFNLVNLDTVGRVYGIPNSPNTSYIPDAGYVSNNSGAASSDTRFGGANAPFITPWVTYTNPSSSGTAPGGTPISEYLLHSLHALTDYLKRHQLSGSRSFERYLSRFGKALPSEKMNRSRYLGASIQDIQIGDVMSTADTLDAQGVGAQLGSFAGKGMSYGTGHFDYSTDEFGYFFIITSIVPNIGYFQGIDRQVMRTSKLQFFTPEFESLGTQPITAAELYIPQRAGEMTTGDPYEQIFGFAPRYADYKVGRDRVTGNFRLRSLNGTSSVNAADSWYLMRVFDGSDDFSGDYAYVVHNPNFLSGSSDASQFKRIFYDTDSDSPDNFTVISNFNVTAYSPMKSLYDTYEFEDKGKKVTLESNGVKLN